MAPAAFWTVALCVATSWTAAAEPAGGLAAGSRDVLPGPVVVEVMRVLDGDTVAVRAHTWLGTSVETRVRLEGIDAPELHARCDLERSLAERARDHLTALLGDREARLYDIHSDKYGGRVRGRLTNAAGIDVAEAMIAAGLARRYQGDARRPWCPREG
jgi:endonuclease YncB( thermonuclease family)